MILTFKDFFRTVLRLCLVFSLTSSTTFALPITGNNTLDDTQELVGSRLLYNEMTPNPQLTNGTSLVRNERSSDLNDLITVVRFVFDYPVVSGVGLLLAAGVTCFAYYTMAKHPGVVLVAYFGAFGLTYILRKLGVE